MKVPKGKKVFSGAHRYKAGSELPAHLSEKLDKKKSSTNKVSAGKPDAYKTSVDMK